MNQFEPKVPAEEKHTMSPETIELSTGAKVPPVEKLSDSQLWQLTLIPEEKRMPEDIKEYLQAAKKEFGRRKIKLKPIITAKRKAPPAKKAPWKMTSIDYAEMKAGKGSAQLKRWQNVHYGCVKQASEQGKPVPREVLEEYKDETWAREALKKLETLFPKTVKKIVEGK